MSVYFCENNFNTMKIYNQKNPKDYECPSVSEIIFRNEGVLCSSIEGLGTKFDYVWGDEE